MAFTETKVFATVMGDKLVGCYKLTGDASDTAWSTPLKVIDAAWLIPAEALPATVSPVAGSTVALPTQTSREITWATNVITFGSAPCTGSTTYVIYVGY